MSTKKICVIANGYAEEMMAAKLMDELRINLEQIDTLDQYQFIGGSLVSSGKWFQDERFPTFFSGGVTPSGGFPTKSIKGFFADLWAGAFFTPFRLINIIKNWSKYNLEIIIVVGDFLLMMLAVPALKRKKIPLIFIPTAKSDYIQPHFKIEKKYIKKYATMSFPRDQITTDNFNNYGINAMFCGNMIQDLLNKNVPLIRAEEPIIAILPGSRNEAYTNLEMILGIIPSIKKSVHWAFVQAASLEFQKIEDIFILKQWTKKEENQVIVWIKQQHKIYCYSHTMYDNVALSCDMAISLAGTAGEQIAGLGKPIIGFKGSGPQSTSIRMQDNQKLLGDAFIYVQDYPQGVVQTIEYLLSDKEECKRRGDVGIIRMGKSGGTSKIAQYICNEVLEKS